MSRKERSKFPAVLIGLLLVMILLLLAWFGVPFMVQKEFGQPVNYLTGFDRWNFSFQVLLGKRNLTTSVGNIAEEIEFSISSGESVSSVANRLESAGLIHDAAAFRAYLVYKGLDSQIKADTFSLSPGATGLEIADSIQSTYTESVPFYIYPGWRAEEIAAALPTSGIEVDADDFLRIVHDPSRLAGKTSFADYPSLDGFLFPGEYEIERKITAKELVMVFLDNYNEQVPPEVYAAIEAQGLSLYEGITLASIIQRETFKDEERARMASVFYNRLRDGIKLETDPTVQYTLGYSSEWGNWWKTPLKIRDLQVNSPYNTYNVYGLPPTPIANPGLPSILAVAYPEDTPYYYFRAMCDDSGYHDFSVTFEEHLSKECK